MNHVPGNPGANLNCRAEFYTSHCVLSAVTVVIRMKFAHILDERERTGPVRLVGHYIKYRSLKKLLKGANAGASAEFLAELDCEIARTCDVVQAEQKEIARLQDEVAQLRRGKAASSPRDRVILEGALWKRISELRSFVETAYETVYKAVKKHDKITKIALMDSVSDACGVSLCH